jgi:SNF2 family DNA or RNA helicase
VSDASREKSADPTADFSSLQEFFTSALEDFSEDADVDKALGKLGLPALDARFAEMTINLMPHQVLGVSWMLEKEKDKKFRGGLLCDAMGESSSGGASEVNGLTPCRSWQGPWSSSVSSNWNC